MRLLRTGLLAWSVAAALCAQGPTMASASNVEQAELNNAVGEANGSQLDLIVALDRHLRRYPASGQRVPIEDAILKAALEANENHWIAEYGERVLARQVSSDLVILDRVARALLEPGVPNGPIRALAVAKRYESTILEMAQRTPEGHLTRGQWALEVEKGLSRAFSLQSHAAGAAGNVTVAAALALQAWEHWPTGEAAREAGNWFQAQNKAAEAVKWYANAFAIDDPRTTPEQRAKDRTKLAELYRKANGNSEKGLGEMILAAYDAAGAARTARIRLQLPKDRNIEATSVTEFQLTALEGPALALKSLAGKTMVLDFWATWCTPCLAQHPMIERVKKKFSDSGDVVFLALDADDDHSLVAPFIAKQKWEGPIYFEDGLARLMNIGSLPTILIVNGEGRITSRMNGYVPEKFEAMLEQRILESRESTRR